MGGEPWQLIEPVDGFHPSQVKTQPQQMGGSSWDASARCCPRRPVSMQWGYRSGGVLLKRGDGFSPRADSPVSASCTLF